MSADPMSKAMSLSLFDVVETGYELMSRSIMELVAEAKAKVPAIKLHRYKHA